MGRRQLTTIMEYDNYDYLDSDEARYEGYDTDDDSGIGYGYLSKCSSQEYDDVPDYGDDDFSDDAEEENAEEEDGQAGIDEELSDELDAGESWDDTDNSASCESYVLDGHEYKDPRQYVSALYRKDVSQHEQLSDEEQIALAHVIRRGMLCDCSVMPENPKVPEEYPYKLVDLTSRVFKRLKQTEEEKEWVESLSKEEKQVYIDKGRSAQVKLNSCNLPLVIHIARAEYNKMEFLDRVQAGNKGLMKAVQYFNPYKGKKFISFAVPLIQNEIRNESKKLKMQKAGPKVWDIHIPTEMDIDAACELMGGKYWINEITFDTNQSKELIRKQVGVLLEQKAYAESIVTDIISGIPERYDEVLANAEEGTTLGVISKTDDDKKRKHLDILKGDGKQAKKRELSTENYIRRFFKTVIRMKTCPSERLGLYILCNIVTIQRQARILKIFLKDHYRYTKETAISDLGQLIAAGYIWPEHPQINKARGWDWTGIGDDNPVYDIVTDYSEYIDKKRPTESKALFLLNNYLPQRQKDILEDARVESEYCDWICEIIRLTNEERLDELNRNLLEDFAAGTTYETIEARYHISSKTVRKRKLEIQNYIYDQIIESSNQQNGKALMSYLEFRYQTWEIKKWKDAIIQKITDDHYIEKGPIALRSRGAADGPRPFLENVNKIVSSVERIRPWIDSDILDENGFFNRTLQSLGDLFKSEAYEIIMREANKYYTVDEMGELAADESSNICTGPPDFDGDAGIS